MSIRFVVVLLLASAQLAAAQAPPPKPAPDLWVKAILAPPGGATFTPGARFTVAISVQNRGTAVAPGAAHGGYVVDLSLGTAAAGFPPAPHALPAPYRFVEGMLLSGGRISRTADLAPGASQEYAATVTVPQDIKPGRYWLGITVDPFGRVPEPAPYPRGENDNVTNTDIEIPRPR